MRANPGDIVYLKGDHHPYEVLPQRAEWSGDDPDHVTVVDAVGEKQYLCKPIRTRLANIVRNVTELREKGFAVKYYVGRSPVQGTLFRGEDGQIVFVVDYSGEAIRPEEFPAGSILEFDRRSGWAYPDEYMAMGRELLAAARAAGYPVRS